MEAETLAFYRPPPARHNGKGKFLTCDTHLHPPHIQLLFFHVIIQKRRKKPPPLFSDTRKMCREDFFPQSRGGKGKETPGKINLGKSFFVLVEGRESAAAIRFFSLRFSLFLTPSSICLPPPSFSFPAVSVGRETRNIMNS